jgi:hypothetical protein
MPVLNFSFSVGTAATQICWPTGGQNKYVYVQNADYDGDTEIYVGGSAVTTSTGHRVWRDGNAVYEIDGDDEMYAICSAAGGTVRVIEIR